MSAQLGAQDAQFLYLQSGDVLTHVMSIDVYAPARVRGRRRPLRFEDIVRHVVERSDLAPVYRRKLHRVPGDLDLPYWIEDTGFDPATHVSSARLPRPGSWAQFCRVAARRFEQPMDLDRPLWDILVVEGLDAIPGVEPGSRALLTRFHHAAIDGASGAHALAALCDRDAHGTPAVDRDKRSHSADSSHGTPGAATMITRALRAGVLSPVRVMDRVLRRSPGIVAEAARGIVGAGRSGSPPVTRFNHRISKRRSFAATRVPLAGLRAIRAAVPGATVNDVVLAICAGGLRDYLHHHDEYPPRTLTAIVPINARPKESEGDPSGNDVTAMSVPLASDIADPIERLRAIQAHTSAAKEARAGLATRVIAEVSRELPGVAVSLLSRLLAGERVARSQGNLVITNVPSSPVTLYMRGCRLTHEFGMGPITHGLGLFISANGYDGVISFCVTADPVLVPDTARLCRCIDASFRQLQRASARAARR